MELRVEMPYIGGVLSVNAYKVRGRSGVATNATRREVKIWMGQLTEKVKGFQHSGSIIVSVFGKFSDGRVPDLDNLAKVILDAIKVGVELDDRYMKYRAIGFDTGYVKPILVITLENEEGA